MPERSLSSSISIGLCSLFLTLAACRRSETEQTPLASSTAPAPDQVASTDVVESQQDLFGLPLPIGMRISERMQFQAKAIGKLPFEQVANYVRDHVDAKNVETGPSSTVFEAAKVKKPRPAAGGKAYPDLVMRVVVKKSGTQTEVGVWADEVIPDDAPYVEQPPRPSDDVPRDPDKNDEP
jgi:hypothetical protein